MERQLTADEAYLTESITDPSAKVVQGFQANVMPKFSLTMPKSRPLWLTSRR